MQPDYISSDKATIRFFNCDNREFMQDIPDKFYDLAIIDPPYGIKADDKNSVKKLQSIKSSALSKFYGNQKWDSNIPDIDYFNELFRISEKQIIWGANYYGLIGGYIYWHKNVTMPTYSSGELAWKSFENKIDFVDITWHGMLQENMKDKEIRIHPTQKPIQLYRWLLQNYAKPGDKIFDSHGGSFSSAIACDMEGFDLDIMEIDKDYFDQALNRFKQYKKQLIIQF